MSFTYSLEHGSYYFRDDRGEIRFMTDEVAVMLDLSIEDCPVLLKHGRPELVGAYYNKVQAATSADFFAGIRMFEGKFDCSGYGFLFLAAHHITPEITHAETG